MRAHRLWLFLVTSLVLIMTGCSETESTRTSDSSEQPPPEYPVTWRFALEEIEGSVQHAYAEALKSRIEEASGGKVELDIFPYGSLGTSSQLTELVRNGSVDLAFASPGHLADLIPETGIFTLHYVLPNEDSVNRALFAGSELTRLFSAAYNEKHLTLLGFVPEGWMAWTANKPLKSPSDFEGLRIRTMTSQMSAEAFRSYGADPRQTPYSQVYSDLQLKQIDGQTNPVFAIEEMNFYEVQDTLTMPRAAHFVSSVVANPEWYAQLPEQQQDWLAVALIEVGKEAWDIQKELNQTRLETMLEEGQLAVTRLSEQERAAFREASKPALEFYLRQTGERGQQILESLRNIITDLENQQASGSGGNGD
ncbi:TRAP-type C4-dicarboxylate transport system substrate-binding protein [Marinobacter pelagius]|uniref:TRAP-type C4-dicarboxylate transport system substrate-binding protein n=1 Tax=Marinobacter pelagius TaxID=379482 RepID=A0A366GM69_9GAMM|nr:TRAP transporter substrate-binding protein DctP [Marinobacter pelagius]RBP28299.1 TRAP-type C4-dicarboxylate transport system substrate-binding protein [Marinobacter pelagius]